MNRSSRRFGSSMIIVLCLALPVAAQEVRTVELPYEGVATISYGVVELFDVNMPVTVNFVFPPQPRPDLAGKLLRAEKEPDVRQPVFDALETRYSGRLFNALGDEVTTIVWRDQPPEWMATFTPTVYPAPEDGRIYLELEITVRWKEPSTASPDAGLYRADLRVTSVEAPEAVAHWANIYPAAFMRGIPQVLARDSGSTSANRALTKIRETRQRGGIQSGPGQQVFGSTSRAERLDRLNYLRALQKSSR